MKYVIILLITAFAGGVNAQTDNWEDLMDVRVQPKFDPDLGFAVPEPELNERQFNLNGKKIVLNGYIIPLEGKIRQSHFMFSAYPYAMCFFCGKAGPETVIEVFMKDDKKVEYSDDKIRLTGILRLNTYDQTNNMYRLEQAELID